MDLILWRHAEAEEGLDDMRRVLTPGGHRQAAQMARWLRARLPKGCRVWASPAARTQQTAVALDMPFETRPEIAPGAAPATLIGLLDTEDANGAVLVVGHQPTLGLVAGSLLLEAGHGLSLKKGAVIWLELAARGGAPHAVLKAAITPALL